MRKFILFLFGFFMLASAAHAALVIPDNSLRIRTASGLTFYIHPQASCPAGEFVSGNTCQSCLANQYQSQDNFTGTSCEPCDTLAFEFSPSGAAGCTLCAGALEYWNNTNCATCTGNGRIANAAHTGCECNTAAGWTGTTTCTCASGWYSRNNACEYCPAITNWYNSVNANPGCRNCPQYGICTATNNGVAVNTFTCNPGFTVNLPGNGSCDCPATNWINASQHCVSCPTGANCDGSTTITCKTQDNFVMNGTNVCVCKTGYHLEAGVCVEDEADCSATGGVRNPIDNTCMCDFNNDYRGEYPNCFNCTAWNQYWNGTTCANCPVGHAPTHDRLGCVCDEMAGWFGSPGNCANTQQLCNASKYHYWFNNTCVECIGTGMIANQDHNSCICDAAAGFVGPPGNCYIISGETSEDVPPCANPLCGTYLYTGVNPNERRQCPAKYFSSGDGISSTIVPSGGEGNPGTAILGTSECTPCHMWMHDNHTYFWNPVRNSCDSCSAINGAYCPGPPNGHDLSTTPPKPPTSGEQDLSRLIGLEGQTIIGFRCQSYATPNYGNANTPPTCDLRCPVLNQYWDGEKCALCDGETDPSHSYCARGSEWDCTAPIANQRDCEAIVTPVTGHWPTWMYELAICTCHNGFYISNNNKIKCNPGGAINDLKNNDNKYLCGNTMRAW